MTEIGHNANRVGGLAVEQLKSIIQRAENLEESKASIAADLRDLFVEAKGNGLDVPAIKKILKLRKLEPQEREEQETILHTYLHALQMDLFPESEPDAGARRDAAG